MPAVGLFLSRLGRHGPLLLVLSLVAGLLVPPLAAAAHHGLLVSAFILALGSFVTASLSPPEGSSDRRVVAAVSVWVAAGVPLAALGLTIVLSMEGPVEAGLLFAVLAPPVGSAAAIAGLLGLQPRLALVVSVTLTLASPLVLPLGATALGLSMSLDTLRLGITLALLIGSAALLSHVLCRWRDRVQAVLPDAQAAAGVAVIGLVIVGLAVMSPIPHFLAEDPQRLLALGALALAVNLGMGALGTVLFWPLGARAALTVGLVSGNRNVTMAWAAAGASLPAATEQYLTICVIPVLCLPLIIRATLSLRRRVREAVAGRAAARLARI